MIAIKSRFVRTYIHNNKVRDGTSENSDRTATLAPIAWSLQTHKIYYSHQCKFRYHAKKDEDLSSGRWSYGRKQTLNLSRKIKLPLLMRCKPDKTIQGTSEEILWTLFTIKCHQHLITIYCEDECLYVCMLYPPGCIASWAPNFQVFIVDHRLGCLHFICSKFTLFITVSMNNRIILCCYYVHLSTMLCKQLHTI